MTENDIKIEIIRLVAQLFESSDMSMVSRILEIPNRHGFAQPNTGRFRVCESYSWSTGEREMRGSS